MDCTVAVAAWLTVSPATRAVTEMVPFVFKAGTVTVQFPLEPAVTVCTAPLLTVSEMLALSADVPLTLVAPA